MSNAIKHFLLLLVSLILLSYQVAKPKTTSLAEARELLAKVEKADETEAYDSAFVDWATRAATAFADAQKWDTLCETARYLSYAVFETKSAKTGQFLESLLTRIPADSISLHGKMYNYLGYAFFSLDYLKAFEYELKSIQAIDSQTSDETLAISYNNIAAGYSRLGDYEKANTYYTKALQINRKLRKIKSCEINAQGLAENYYYASNIDSAQHYMQLSRGFSATQSADNKIIACGLLLAKGDTTAALRTAKKLIIEFDEKEAAYTKLGEIYEAITDFQKAEKAYQTALDYTDSTDLREIGKSNCRIGHMLELQHKYPDALIAYQRALTYFVPNFNDTSTQITNPQIKDLTLEIWVLDVLIGKGNCFNALQKRDIAHQCYDLAVQAVEQKRISLTEIGSKRLFQNYFVPLVYEPAIKLALQVGQTERAFQYSEQSKYALVREAVTNAATNPLPPSTALIEYFVGRYSLYIFVVEAQHKPHTIVEILPPNHRLDTLIAAFMAQMSDPNTQPDTTIGNALSQLLLAAPLSTTKADALIFVPDGVLNSLNFELLPQPNSNTMLFDHKIVSHALSKLLLHHTDRKAAFSYAGFAPKYTNQALPDMPQTRRDAQALATAWGGSAWTADSADIASFKQHAPASDVIHFMGHTMAQPDSAVSGYLAFGGQTPEKGQLSSDTIQHLNLQQTRLAVLTACNTGKGKQQLGEGTISLGWAFARAGCPSIVYSLWPVPAEQTMSMTTSFFGFLRDGQPKNTALRRAKQAYLTTCAPEFRHPYYWAGFVLVGDTSALVSKSGYKWGILGLVLALLIGGFLWQKLRG